MRFAFCLLLLAPLAARGADPLGPTLRALKSDERDRRREALEAFAEARIRPESRREGERIEEALERFLSPGTPGNERALAVRGLGRLERPSAHLAVARWLEREEDDRVLDAAADLFRIAAPEALFHLLGRLDQEPDPLRRAVYLRMIGMAGDPEARRRVRLRAGGESEWCPRAAAALALGYHSHRDSFPPLMALLDQEDPGVVAAAVESLTRLTGLRHGRDLPAWKAWWGVRGEADPLAPPPAASDPEAPKPDAHRYAHERPDAKEDPIAYYFGIPVRGKEVVFVYDVSASMRYKLPLAHDQLTRAVKGLASHVRFEVIFFNEFVWPWRGRLSRADPVTKELLVRHLPTIEIKSYTNIFDSLEMALALDPDEIFVISDGEPNRGRRRLPRDLLSEVRKLNPGSIPIHTISIVRVVDGDNHQKLLATLAEENGGTHVQRTLK